jgi:hypothetical protein
MKRGTTARRAREALASTEAYKKDHQRFMAAVKGALAIEEEMARKYPKAGVYGGASGLSDILHHAKKTRRRTLMTVSRGWGSEVGLEKK